MSAGMEVRSEIFSQRLITAVLWNMLLQVSLAVLLVFIIQADFLHPLSWIGSTFRDVVGWKMMFNIVLLGLVSFFQAYIYGCYYMVPMPKYFTRFSIFLNLFTAQNVVFGILYSLCGYFTMGLYSSLAQNTFSALKKTCINYDGQCLIEQNLFLQFGGMWMGVYYFLKVHIFSINVLLFPHIHQDKFQQIKLAIGNVFAMGFRNSFTPVLYYCVFYYLWGSHIRQVVSEVYGLYLEDPPLTNVLNLVSSGIWIGVWFYTSLFFVSIYMMRTIFNIVLTEPMQFPIESERNLTLHKALAQRSQFNGYLGARYFKTMALTEPKCRQQIFKLSQPGGHPRNWNKLLEISLVIIQDFCKELESINGNAKHLGSRSSPQKNSLNITPPAGLQFPGAGLRNMAMYSPQLLELKDHDRQNEDKTFTTILKEECMSFMHKMSQKPGISYFFGELTDTKLRFLLTQAQPLMWTCEGLAFIVAASLKEDKYGVVQTDLATVLSTLIHLKQVLDKLSKPGLVPRKIILHDEFAVRMKSALISSVKRSIYKIVVTFSKYIHEIPLDLEIQTAIQPFLLCKEA